MATIIGTRLVDRLYGTEDGDLIKARAGFFDYVAAGGGDDTIYGCRGLDVLGGQDGNDLIYAGRSEDILVGGFGNDTLFGGSGGDQLGGSSGTDVLRGGRGKDYLNGGADQDDLRGGRGADTFIFQTEDLTTDGSAADRILDFGKNDRVRIETFDSIFGDDPRQATDADWADGILLLDGNRLFFDADGSAGSGVAVAVATFVGGFAQFDHSDVWLQ